MFNMSYIRHLVLFILRLRYTATYGAIPHQHNYVAAKPLLLNLIIFASLSFFSTIRW